MLKNGPFPTPVSAGSGSKGRSAFVFGRNSQSVDSPRVFQIADYRVVQGPSRVKKFIKSG